MLARARGAPRIYMRTPNSKVLVGVAGLQKQEAEAG